MRFPDRKVQIDSGANVPLSSFWEAAPVAFVFLRHLGCIFCKQHVAELGRHPELNVVFVCMGAPSNATVFKATMRVTNVFICDPQKTLYDETGLRSAGLAQILHPRVILKGVRATLGGHLNGRPPTDPLVLGGTFVVDQSGQVIFSHRAADPADNSSVEDIRRALMG